MKPDTKKILILLITILMTISAFGCGSGSDAGANGTDTDPGTDTGTETAVITESYLLEDPEDASRTADGQFLITGGTYDTAGDTFTITSAGEHTLRGSLEDGQIVVDAPEDAEVTLILDGADISCSTGSPILILGADEVKIKSSDGSYNTVTDGRSGSDDTEEYDGAVYAECDLKLTGSGTLIVKSSYTNGIKSKNDVTLKNVTLKVVSRGVALKGNDTVSMESGSVMLISSEAEGIKTSDSDISSKGNQRGTVTILSGRLNIYSALDGISAAHDVVTGGDSDGPDIYIYAGNSSTYTASSLAGEEAKGIVTDNDIVISAGYLTVSSTDDCLHARRGEALESGAVSTGDIYISGGSIILSSGDDAIHADGTIRLEGGDVNVSDSHEGVEANVIDISAGSLKITATDDGLNATAGDSQTAIVISGGLVDVTVTGNDVDAIDSNGTITVSGGTVISRSTSAMNGMAGSFDADYGITVTGGTVMGFGGICSVPEAGDISVFISDGTVFSEGKYELRSTSGEVLAEFELSRSFTSLMLASDRIVTGESYSIYMDGNEVLSWTQDSARTGNYSQQGAPGGARW